MGQHYRSAAVVPDGGPDMDPPGADYTPTATPGCRAPHHPLPGGGSTIDLFDRDFVLLTASSAWQATASRLRVPLTCHVITDPAWPATYGVTPAGAVLVRPDGHVAWRRPATEAPGEGLAQVLTRVAATREPVLSD
jgi:tetracenomycin A2 monooxygenase-dioxygenase